MPQPQHPSPIIVFGAPRSGTTYLNGILNKHPEVFVTHETRLFAWMHKALRGLTANDDLVLNHRAEFTAHLEEAMPGVIRDFYRKLRPTCYWGDKNPHYASVANRGCLETIAAVFPGTRFIHIIRDGRDVAASLLKRGWASFEGAHDVWKNHVDRGREFGQSQADGLYFEMRYEELIADDAAMARRLFEFLDIPIRPRVIAFCERQRESRTPLSGPTRDLSQGATASAWAGMFTPENQARSLDLLRDHLIKYGYETQASFAAKRAALPEIDAEAAAAASVQECASEKHRAARLREEVRGACAALPDDASVLVVSKGDEALLDMGRRAGHFPQSDEGTYAGHYPGDSGEAIDHLEALRGRGGQYLLIPEPSFWWLDHYQGLREHLDAYYTRVRADEHCVLYRIAERRSCVAEAR